MGGRSAAGTWDRPVRSWLFVPGNRDRMIAKSASVGADVVIFDLEDSVPPSEKAIAREKVGRQIAKQPAFPTGSDAGPPAFVRINRAEGDELTAELLSVVSQGLAGICVPKVESPSQVTKVSKMLGKIELEAPLPAGSVRLLLQIETARGLRQLLIGSELRKSHEDCDRVQDSYSLRCMPQVHGAVRDALGYVTGIVETEINSITDNPMIFVDGGDVISGGNFHGENARAVPEVADIEMRRERARGARKDQERTDARRAHAEQVLFVSRRDTNSHRQCGTRREAAFEA